MLPPTSVAPTDPYLTTLIVADGLLPGVRVLLEDKTRYASGNHKEPAARAVVARAVVLTGR